jgi:hypothetical protein
VLGIDLDEVAAALVACWRHGDIGGLTFPLDQGRTLARWSGQR